MNFDYGVIITLLSYLVFITAFVVRMDTRVKTLENLHLDYKEHIKVLQDLKNEVIELKAELKHHCPYQKKSIKG